MDGSLDGRPVVIRQSRLRLSLQFGLWLALALGLVLVLQVRQTVPLHGPDIGKAFTAVLLYGALFVFTSLAVFTVMMLLNPAVLSLGPGGLTFKSMWSTVQLAWNDIDHFYVRGTSRSREVVFYNLSQWYLWEHPHRRSPLGSLGANWEMAVSELSDLLNRAKARWGDDLVPHDPHGTAAAR